MKPTYKIVIAPGAQSPLAAHHVLPLLPIDRCHHLQNNLRLPLGIYNVSITRVCQKLESFCRRLEDYTKAASCLDDLQAQGALRRELIDYTELSIYAAAEHVDDIDPIVKGLFRDAKQCEKRPAYRQFAKEIKT